MTLSRISGLLLAIGLGVSIYLTWQHFTENASLICAESEVMNCASVTTSTYSRLFGIPVAILGLGYYAASCVLWQVAAHHSPAAKKLELPWYGLGLVFVLYLIWAELVPLGQICAWCTVVHITTIGLFLIALTERINR